MEPKEFLLRETFIVSPNNGYNPQTVSYKVLNIPLDLGKTLQDIKYADCSGGYVYNCTDGMVSARVRNRVIYWRSHQCTLELVEECLDTQLRNSRVKLAFTDTPVLDVHIAEMCTDVYLLVCTTGGLVRFLLHHPAQLKDPGLTGVSEGPPYSFLHSVSSSSYQVCQPRGAPFRGHVRCATAWLNPVDCSAYAAYGLSGGDIQLLRMLPPGQQLQQRVVQPTVELRLSSLFDRLLGGWISTVGGGGGSSGGGGSGSGGSGSGGGGSGGETSADDAATSLAFWTDVAAAASAAFSSTSPAAASGGDPMTAQSFAPPVALLAATRDHKLRLWDVERRECYWALDLLTCLPDPAARGPLHNRGHQLRLCRQQVGASAASSSSWSLLGCLYANFTERPCFLPLEAQSAAASGDSLTTAAAAASRRLRLRVRRAVPSPGRDLLDLAVEPEIAWALYADAQVNYRLYGVGLGWAPSGYRLARCQLLDADQGPLAPSDHASRLCRAFGGREFAPDSVRRSLRLFLDESSLTAHLDQLESAASAVAGDDAPTSASSAACSSLEFLRSLLLDTVDTLAQEEMVASAAAGPSAVAATATFLLDANAGGEDLDALEQRRAWHVDRFYSQLLQLHAMDTAVCGLLADWGRSGFVGVVRRRFLGLLRPADTAELCQLLPDTDGLGPEALSEVPALEDAQGTRDFITAVTACQRLLGALEPGLADQLIGDLQQLALANACQEAPTVAARASRNPMVRRACHQLGDTLLQSLCEPVSAFATLITALESADFLDDVDLTLLGGHQPQLAPQHIASLARQRGGVGGSRQLLSGWSAAELLANGLSQSVDSRLRLLTACLLLFAQLPDRFAGLCSELTARAVDLLRHLGLVRWCCDLVYSPAPPRLLESLRSQLGLLLAAGHLAPMDAGALDGILTDCPALAAWFACGGAGDAVRRLLRTRQQQQMENVGEDADMPDDADCMLGGGVGFGDLLPTSVALLHHLLSPERGGLSFAIFLLWAGQLEALHTFTGACLGWARADPATLYALRGLALVNQPGLADLPEPDALADAVDCLAEAVQLAADDSSTGQPPPLCQPGFLHLVGLQQQRGLSPASLYVHLVRVLEPLRCSEQIVSLARRGLSRCLPPRDGSAGRFDLPLRATVFKHELELGRCQRALDAALELSDPSAQLDCIRHLVVTLSDRDQLGQLLSLEFGRLSNAFVSVLEMRARAVDAGLHVYYNLLYCYHSNRSDCKRAAAAMHELSVRLARDRGFDAAQRQARALLCAIGCLRLLDTRHQWVAVPEDFLEDAAGSAPGLRQQEMGGSAAGLTPPETGDDGGWGEEATGEGEEEARPVRVLTLADLEQRYAVLSAQLQLSLRHQPHGCLQLPTISAAPLGSSAAAAVAASAAASAAAAASSAARGLDELIADLLSAGLYHEARCLLLRHGRAPTPLLEALATAAVTASGFVSTTEEAFAAVKEALEEEGASAEGASPADCLWNLLQLYAERYDWPGAPGLKAIAQRLMLLDYPAPAWLTKLYADRDPSGLLRLYIAHDRVEEAAELSRRLVDTARIDALAAAAGPEAAVAGSRRAPCLPFTQILQIREGLRLLGAPAQSWLARLQASLAEYSAVCDQRLLSV